MVIPKLSSAILATYPDISINFSTPAPIAAYSIYMDNYFTSVALFQELYEAGYGACGTACSTTEDLPPVFKQLQEYSKAFPWGTLHAMSLRNVLYLA